MILTDYLRSDKDITWDYAKQCGVTHGVIRLPENKEFDLTDKTHWETVHKRFTDYGIKPIIIEPMPNEVHDHIKAGDEKRDECIEKVIKMLPIMRDLDIGTICFNWMAHVGWLRTRSDYPERGGAKVTQFNMADFKPSGAKITENQLWENYEYFIKAVIPEAEKYGMVMSDKAIEKCGRPIVLSLSPGPAEVSESWHYKKYANMWRITDDFWDNWETLLYMFDRCEKWQDHVSQGCWPDCDMLPLGKVGKHFGCERDTLLSKDEQMTMMTLWCMFGSPLMLGAEMTMLDEWTLSLLQKEELLRLENGSYLDVGTPTGPALPVVIKTLILSAH